MYVAYGFILYLAKGYGSLTLIHFFTYISLPPITLGILTFLNSQHFYGKLEKNSSASLQLINYSLSDSCIKFFINMIMLILTSVLLVDAKIGL